MKVPIVVVIYVLFVTRIESVHNRTESPIASSRQKDICDDFPQIKCSSDCSSVMVCHDETSPPLNLKCPPNKPYCANGKCGTTKENCLIDPKVNAKVDPNVSSFVCTSDGDFPDPLDCTKKYVCNGTSYVHAPCDPGLIYNSKFDSCDRGVPRIDHASKRICQKISCDNKPNGYILFPANPAFYAYCSNNSMTLFKCDDVMNQVFDISAEKCVFKCSSAGYFPDPLDCTAYYYCRGIIRFKQTRLSCADGHYFDGTKCINGIGCSPTIPTTSTSTSTSTPTTTSTSTSTSPSISTSTIPTTSTSASTSTSTSTTADSRDILYISSNKVPHIVNDEKTNSSILPTHSLWKHKGKYSYRLDKGL